MFTVVSAGSSRAELTSGTQSVGADTARWPNYYGTIEAASGTMRLALDIAPLGLSLLLPGPIREVLGSDPLAPETT
jgi:hypothetical protein